MVEEELLEELETKLLDKTTVILYNDHVNTFDFVIETLVDVCEHDMIQAEQVAHIVHFKGKCAVKSGELVAMKQVCSELLRRGLTADFK